MHLLFLQLQMVGELLERVVRRCGVRMFKGVKIPLPKAQIKKNVRIFLIAVCDEED